MSADFCRPGRPAKTTKDRRSVTSLLPVTPAGVPVGRRAASTRPVNSNDLWNTGGRYAHIRESLQNRKLGGMRASRPTDANRAAPYMNRKAQMLAHIAGSGKKQLPKKTKRPVLKIRTDLNLRYHLNCRLHRHKPYMASHSSECEHIPGL